MTKGQHYPVLWLLLIAGSFASFWVGTKFFWLAASIAVSLGVSNYSVASAIGIGAAFLVTISSFVILCTTIERIKKDRYQ